MSQDLWTLTERVVGAMIQVHRQLGPGLLESTYEACLAEELHHESIPFRRQAPLTIQYRNASITSAYVADFIVDDRLLVELKSVDTLLPIHVAQVLTYLKLTQLEVALLANFNAVTLRSGLRRLTRRDQRPR